MLWLWIVGINQPFWAAFAYQKSHLFKLSIFKLHLHRVSFDVLHCYPWLLLMSNKLRTLSPRGRSTLMYVLGRAVWRGFCLEDMTCLKRQRHCDASRLHLCTLSLFFRKVTCFAVCCGDIQPDCMQAAVMKAFCWCPHALMKPLMLCMLIEN